MSTMTLTRPRQRPEPQSPGLQSPGPQPPGLQSPGLQSYCVRLASGLAAVPAARREVQAALRAWAVPADAESGWGLHLVASLSDEWGYYRTPAGKAVYFMLAFGPDPAPGVGGRSMPGDGEP